MDFCFWVLVVAIALPLVRSFVGEELNPAFSSLSEEAEVLWGTYQTSY